MRTAFLCISVLRVASGPRVKLTGCWSALTPIHPTTDRSKAVVPVLVLLLVFLAKHLDSKMYLKFGFYQMDTIVLFIGPREI